MDEHTKKLLGFYLLVVLTAGSGLFIEYIIHTTLPLSVIAFIVTVWGGLIVLTEELIRHHFKVPKEVSTGPG